MWIKISIIIIGSLYSIILPYIIRKSIDHYQLDIRTYTLSFLSNKTLYSKKCARGYTRLLILTAVLHYAFFWLLTRYYLLGDEERYLSYLDYSFLFLTLLGLLKHNILPYSFKTLRMAIQRMGHNVVAVFVFLAIPALILSFQILVLDNFPILGIGGLIIIGLVILFTLLSIIKQGINGITELIFINGLSIWTIYATLITVFFN